MCEYNQEDIQRMYNKASCRTRIDACPLRRGGITTRLTHLSKSTRVMAPTNQHMINRKIHNPVG